MQSELSKQEILRYSRHLLLPEVGKSGQERLKSAKVLMIGAGGLGCPVATYLAAAGIGHIGLVDFDHVEASNLQRQILFGEDDCGTPKVAAAASQLTRINPHIQITQHQERLSVDNALSLMADYDLVIDGTDNFPTRYLANDAAFLAGKPYVYGSVFRFEGQASVFDGRNGPCYRCLFPEAPPPGTVPSCAEGGVLGVLPGTIGMLQATEAIKLILGVGESLLGRLVIYDALNMRFQTLKVHRNPDCELCGSGKKLTDLQHHLDQPASTTASRAPEISPQQLAERLQHEPGVQLIDVRQPEEAAIASLPNAKLIPLDSLLRRETPIGSIDADVVVYCKLGGRSQTAAQHLIETLGHTKVVSLAGGITAWRQEIDPSLNEY